MDILYINLTIPTYSVYICPSPGGIVHDDPNLCQKVVAKCTFPHDFRIGEAHTGLYIQRLTLMTDRRIQIHSNIALITTNEALLFCSLFQTTAIV